MNCRELTDFLADYLAEELPAGTRATFEAHLTRCHDCTVFLAQYRETLTLSQLAMSPEESVAPDLPEDLVRAILEALAED